ncbi:MAG: hypothetical protein IT379_05380, partial [Deltaproteobacteria bacterium]|nr:hypothetical protein [Deltaproteobacteria bacterium]
MSGWSVARAFAPWVIMLVACSDSAARDDDAALDGPQDPREAGPIDRDASTSEGGADSGPADPPDAARVETDAGETCPLGSCPPSIPTIAVGHGHACAIDDGALVCWGARLDASPYNYDPGELP